MGVAEHPDIMETIEKELEIIAEYDDKLEIIKKYFPLKSETKEYKDFKNLHLINLEPNKEVHLKITRPSEYGERYKLFVIPCIETLTSLINIP